MNNSPNAFPMPFLKPSVPSRYKPYEITRRYIRQKYDAVPKNVKGTFPLDAEQWMQELGYTNKNKFVRRLNKDWLTLRGLVPRTFIRLIDIDMKQLEDVFALDKDRYYVALKNVKPPKYFLHRLMAAIYRQVEFPHEMTLDEAIDFIRSEFEGKPKSLHHAVMSYGILKSVFVTPDNHFTVYYEPKMKVTDRFIEFCREDMPGTVRIRGKRI